jgi:hypothetical protein
MSKTLYIQFSDIVDLFPRNYYQRPTALELFLEDGRSFFIDFAPVANTEILSAFSSYTSRTAPLEELTQRWVGGEISNFSYLMQLNLLSGRSFHDVLQYPVFPNIRPSRDLSRPLKQMAETDLGVDALFHDSVLPPSVVDRTLGRLEPFTSVHLRGCGGLDESQSDLFTSAQSLAESELPADLYFQSEIGQDLNSLGLPELPRSDCFAYDYRKRLESPEITADLHLWIDFVFGFRQKGKDAREIGNFAHPAILDDFVTDRPNFDPATVKDLLKLYGVAPMQLFQAPHQSRVGSAHEVAEILTHTSSPAPLLFASRVARGELWLVDVSGRILSFQFDGCDGDRSYAPNSKGFRFHTV